MRSYDEIFQQIKKILNEEFEIPAEKITPEARFVEDLDLDSIDAVDLVVRLQNIIKKTISTQDFKSIRTLDDIVKVIEKMLNA